MNTTVLGDMGASNYVGVYGRTDDDAGQGCGELNPNGTLSMNSKLHEAAVPGAMPSEQLPDKPAAPFTVCSQQARRARPEQPRT